MKTPRPGLGAKAGIAIGIAVVLAIAGYVILNSVDSQPTSETQPATASEDLSGDKPDNPCKTERVGRWMSKEEYEVMKRTGMVQESQSGTTHVTRPPNPDAYSASKPGSYYVEFDVPAAFLVETQAGWAKIIGPNSLEGRLAARKCQPITEMPPAANIEHVTTKE